MLPVVCGEKSFRNWAAGCTTKGNPSETAANADPAGETTGDSERSLSEWTITGPTKPPAIAFEARSEQRRQLEQGTLALLRLSDGVSRRAEITPITAGTATITETKALEEPAMTATATATYSMTAPVVLEPVPADHLIRLRPLKSTDRVSASRTAAARQAQRDQIVLENLPLVKAIAVRVHENLPVHVDLDDLVHAGILGLFDAATKYDPEKMVSFSSYAKHRIKGSILDSLRQLDWASRDLRRRRFCSQQLKGRQAKQVPVNHRHPLQLPVLRPPRDQRVQKLLLLKGTTQQGLHKRVRLRQPLVFLGVKRVVVVPHRVVRSDFSNIAFV